MREAVTDRIDPELETLLTVTAEDEALLRAQQLARDVEVGKAMAIVTYASVMVGLPLFLVPMVRRQNRFALHHARAAGAIYLFGTALVVAAFTNCALFLPLAFACYIPALIGIYRAAAGARAGTAAFQPLGDRLFSWIKIKNSSTEPDESAKSSTTSTPRLPSP